jgi:hypothetical protein
MRISRLLRFVGCALCVLSLSILWIGEGLARQSRYTTNSWHGVDAWCEQVGVMQGNQAVAQLRLGEVYIWHDLAKAAIGSRCVEPIVMPKSGPGHAVHCEASSVAIASFELEVRADGSKSKVLRVMCIE